MDRNNWKEIIDLTTPRQTHPVAFSYFKDKGENVGQEYATIEGKWLWMSRLEKEPYLKKFLQSEQSSLLKNIDLQSQIREVKYGTINHIWQLNRWKIIFLQQRYRTDLTLPYSITSSLQLKISFFSTISLTTSIVKKIPHLLLISFSPTK